MIIRGWAAEFARHLPPKNVADRIIPWLTFCIAFFGVSAGLFQFWSSIDQERVRQSINLYNEYIGRDGSKTSLRDLLNQVLVLNDSLNTIIVSEVGCEYLKELAASKSSLSDAASRCVRDGYGNVSNLFELTPEQRDELRARLSESRLYFIYDDPEGKNIENTIHKLLYHYISVVSCVYQRGCDKNVIFENYFFDMLNFLNAFCIYFEDLGKQWNAAPQDVSLAKFLIENNVGKRIDWTRDQGRQSIFYCDAHRELDLEKMRQEFF